MKRQQVIARALRYLEQDLKQRQPLTAPQAVKDFLKLLFMNLEHEVFVLLYVDSQNRLIGHETLFRGTLDGASVYPREVVKAALRHNAAAVFFAHNHPSGVAEPSAADRVLTERLKSALALIDIRVLDHFVCGGNTAISFAERGWV